MQSLPAPDAHEGGGGAQVQGDGAHEVRYRRLARAANERHKLSEEELRGLLGKVSDFRGELDLSGIGDDRDVLEAKLVRMDAALRRALERLLALPRKEQDIATLRKTG